MRIKKLSAECFGAFKGWESCDLDSNIIIVHGENESGKTTLFKLISTILYGWNPVSDNPYIPWDESYGQCEALISLKDNNDVKVKRSLKSRAEGHVLTGGVRRSLGNGPISCLNYLPNEIFNEVYMLSSDTLRFPDEKTWAMLQDELLGGQYRTMLNPVKQVMSALEEEAAGLWRSDRRGNPKDKRLGENKREMKSKLKEASENEDRLYELEEKIDTLGKEIEALSARRLEINSMLEYSGELYPVYKKKQRLDEYMRAGKYGSQFEYLPDNPFKAISNLEDGKRSLYEEYRSLAKERDRLKGIIDALTEQDKSLLSYRDIIENLKKKYSQIESDINTVSDIENEIERLKDRLDYRSKSVLRGGWQDSCYDILRSIDEAELRSAIDSFSRASSKYNDEYARLSGHKADSRSNFSGALWLIPVLLLLFSSGGLIFSDSTSMMILSGSMLLLGLCFSAIYLIYRKGRKSVIKEAAERVKKAAGDRDEAIDGVGKALNGLPIASQRLQNPGESLVVDVSTLIDLAEKIADDVERRNTIAKRLEDASSTAKAVIAGGRLSPGFSILGSISMLEKNLKCTEERFSEYTRAEASLSEIESSIGNTEKMIKSIESDIKALLSELEKLEGECLEDKCRLLLESREQLKKAETLKEEMEQSYPDLEKLLYRIESISDEGRDWIFDDEKLSAARISKMETENRLMELKEEMGSCKKELEDRLNRERKDDIRGEIERIEVERESIRIKRDKLILLKNIIYEADRRFREENQPGILQKAGEYIKVITGGRYSGLYMDDEDRSLQVTGNYINDLLDVEKRMLSRGTKEQIYLSLRLALMDQLDSKEETLPIFLDEALVDWDSGRFSNTAGLLQEVSHKRQIFIFTCREDLYRYVGGGAVYMELEYR